jgi:hypothetical protein
LNMLKSIRKKPQKPNILKFYSTQAWEPRFQFMITTQSSKQKLIAISVIPNRQSTFQMNLLTFRKLS